MVNRIASIPVDAPLFRKVPEADLRAIVDYISKASMHFADDSSREWAEGNRALRAAAHEINQFSLGYEAIEALYADKPQLATFADLMNVLLKILRS